MKKIIFLDRDGTLIEDRSYICNEKDIVLFPESLIALKKLQNANFKLVIVTNQSGIGRGYFTEKRFNDVNNYFIKLLEKEQIFIKETMYCPDTPETNCNCRKPKVGLVTNYLNNKDIDYENSYMIGDKLSDVEFGKNLGVNQILIKNSEDPDIKKLKNKPFPVVENILEAAESIVR